MGPTPDTTPAEQLGQWLPVLGTLAAVAGWLLARWRSCRRKKAEARALREARDEYARVAGDSIRFLLAKFYSQEMGPDEAMQQAAIHRRDLDDARRLLWLAHGHPEPETDEAEVARRVLREIRRTQPVQGQQDMFAPGSEE
jgi:hypothetical protein